MSQLTGGLYAWTRFSRLYDGFQAALGGERANRMLVEDHIRPRPGERVLDLGCGTGTLLRHLGPVDYVGIDSNPRHIAAARRSFGAGARFECADVSQVETVVSGPFDLVLCVGLFHHLDDEAMQALVPRLALHLAPMGRLISIDPTLIPGQGLVARAMARADAGRCMRTPEHFAELVRAGFSSVEPLVRADMMRVPYTHCILIAREPIQVPHGVEGAARGMAGSHAGAGRTS